MNLDEVRIATPCHARWRDMKGDDQVRRCRACDKNVYNLSALSTREVRELLLRTEGKLCVRFFTRADGTLMTSDCPIGLRRVGLQFVGVWCAAIAFAFGVAALMASWGGLPKTATTLNAWIPRRAAPAPIKTYSEPLEWRKGGPQAQNNAY
jgi:hypothetical protein